MVGRKYNCLEMAIQKPWPTGNFRKFKKKQILRNKIIFQFKNDMNINKTSNCDCKMLMKLSSEIIILCDFEIVQHYDVYSAICYTLYSKDSFFNTLKIAVIKFRAFLKGKYVDSNHLRL